MTMVMVAHFYSKTDAERVRDKLKAELKNSYIQPADICACPRHGLFELTVTTGYEFCGDDGEPFEDQDGAFMQFLLIVLGGML